MQFKLFGVDAAGNEDNLVISGDSIDELREIALSEVEQRGWVDYWSESLD